MTPKLIMVDLDGTLVDTCAINAAAYSEALRPYGVELDYDHFRHHCNGRHYLDFLPDITGGREDIYEPVHEAKKAAYSKHVSLARVNESLVGILRAHREDGGLTALVTTASRRNTGELLDATGLHDLFDLIVTREDVSASKPSPEGFLKAMSMLGVAPDACAIFEDSAPGLQAARASRAAAIFQTLGYN